MLFADCCERLPCRPATDAEVTSCHRADLPARVEAASQRAELLEQAAADGDAEAAAAMRDSCYYFSQDTYANPSTALCARLAAGASIDAAVAVVK